MATLLYWSAAASRNETMPSFWLMDAYISPASIMHSTRGVGYRINHGYRLQNLRKLTRSNLRGTLSAELSSHMLAVLFRLRGGTQDPKRTVQGGNKPYRLSASAAPPSSSTFLAMSASE